jgi:D-sedoheptulose 7-phosphate isomerase
VDINEIILFADVLTNTIQNGGTIYLCGNGGSAATASHIKNDLVKLVFDRTNYPVNCVCLNDNVPLLTALGNDIKYEAIFSEQLMRLSPDSRTDVLLVLSGSGNSDNITRAVTTARVFHEMQALALTGMGGGKVIELANKTIVVASDCMQVIEDVHLSIGHMLVKAVIHQLTGE